MDVAVCARNLVRVYRTRFTRYRALRGVSFTAAPGSFTAITGTSGSGKSTILHLLAGLDRPTSGTITLLGEETTRMSEKELTAFRKAHIGFIFQDYSLLPMTALENVAFPLLLRGIPETVRNHAAREHLEKMGLAAHAHHMPEQLSGGQQQRVCIARSLIADPELLFADEPTGSLDSVGASSVMQTLLQTVHQEHRTLIMVTHDLERAAMADQVIQISDGQIV